MYTIGVDLLFGGQQKRELAEADVEGRTCEIAIFLFDDNYVDGSGEGCLVVSVVNQSAYGVYGLPGRSDCFD